METPVSGGPSNSEGADDASSESTWRRPELTRYGVVNQDTSGIAYRPSDGFNNLT